MRSGAERLHLDQPQNPARLTLAALPRPNVPQGRCGPLRRDHPLPSTHAAALHPCHQGQAMGASDGYPVRDDGPWPLPSIDRRDGRPKPTSATGHFSDRVRFNSAAINSCCFRSRACVVASEWASSPTLATSSDMRYASRVRNRPAWASSAISLRSCASVTGP